MNLKLDEGLSPRTVRHQRGILRGALGQALKWGLVSRNVATLVTSPYVPETEVNPLTADELQAFFMASKDHRLEALFTLTVSTGLRQGEALGLKWPEVDLQKSQLQVRHSLQRINGKLQLVEPKSKRSRRLLRLPQIAVEALKRHRTRQLEQRLAAGKEWQNLGFVFTTRKGTPFDHPTVIRAYHHILKVAGLRHQRFHDTRHCYASLLLAEGVHPRVVMEMLSHSRILSPLIPTRMSSPHCRTMPWPALM